ncbi:unnamed protein product, partial [Timema podura]|nr:unnamed protein product [Timema podura]
INNFLINQPEGSGKRESMSLEEVAIGFIHVANEAMCRPIRALTQIPTKIQLKLFSLAPLEPDKHRTTEFDSYEPFHTPNGHSTLVAALQTNGRFKTGWTIDCQAK